jgi:hypothetical protein
MGSRVSRLRAASFPSTRRIISGSPPILILGKGLRRIVEEIDKDSRNTLVEHFPGVA